MFIFKTYKEYDVLNTLSESDKCVVLSARSKTNGEQVVIRVIYNAAAGVLESLPQVTSPYVTQILEVIQDESDVVVIEKFVNGITVRQLLDGEGQLTEAEALPFFEQLCQALAVIHREGIIHRDIKPSNIMLRDKTAVLIDFDVARKHDPRQSEDTVYMGTKGYAAPEQYGFSQTDGRSDIYSLGVVIKEMLGNNFNTSVYKNIIEKCTRFDPLNRYQTVDEILADLRRFTIKTPVLKTRSKRRSRRSVFKIIGYSCIGLFLIAVIYAVASGIYSGHNNETSSSEPGDERTLETFRNAYTEAGIVLENENIPLFKLIGAKNGIIFYIDGQKVAIYEYVSEKAAERAKKRIALFGDWPTNGKFALETSNEKATAVFNSVGR
jgi:serine/threonine protein kinase